MSEAVLFPLFAPKRPTLAAAIKIYLYIQYNDDETMLGFVQALNELTQEFVDWFNNTDLPVYTKQSGALLDWVAEGLYGLKRGLLPTGIPRIIGGFNTTKFNRIEFNNFQRASPQNFYQETDDVFKRILTWNLYRGDGAQFTIRWLKRRVQRFLEGVNGTDPPVAGTWQVSVGFLSGRRCVINIIRTLRRITGGAMFNRATFNSVPFNNFATESVVYPALPFAPILAAAIAAGACELPFDYQFIVQIEGATLVDLYEQSSVLKVLPEAGYRTSATGLPAGALWRDPATSAVRVVPGITPNPLAPPVFFPGVTAAQLAALGGGNLPTTDPGATGRLWNNTGTVNVS